MSNIKGLTNQDLDRLTHFMSEVNIKIEQFDDVSKKLPKSLTKQINDYTLKLRKERERRFRPTIITIHDTR